MIGIYLYVLVIVIALLSIGVGARKLLAENKDDLGSSRLQGITAIILGIGMLILHFAITTR